MAASWIKKVPVAETTEEGTYFIAKQNGTSGSYFFWSTYLSGKEGWSVKPGLGNRYKGGASLARMFGKNSGMNLVAIEVPPDADKRWKARRPKFRK